MKAWIGAVALGGILVAGQATAQTGYDGNDLLPSCKAFLEAADGKPNASNDLFKMGQCIGTVGGVKSTMYTFDSELSKELRTCFPGDGITDGQAVRIVVRYLETHPESLNESRNLLTLKALHNAYPCK